MAAPLGNQNARKARLWKGALDRAMARIAEGAGVEAGLDKCADQLVRAAMNGDQWALLEIGNRYDGKPAQPISGDDEGPPIHTLSEIVIRGIDADDRRTAEDQDSAP